jgi:hypothetical protein
MLTLIAFRKKNPIGFCKWEVITSRYSYAIIRYKDSILDLRIARNHEEFVLGKVRCLYRAKLDLPDENEIDWEEVVEILDLDVSQISHD